MKTLFRYVLAATLAVTVYSFSNGSSENSAVVVNPTDEFEFVSDHPSFPNTMTRQQIEDYDNANPGKELCPGESQVCATALTITNPPIAPLLWDGPSTKF